MTGSDLHARRIQLRLTQAELARALGVHPNTVARWERDELRIPPIIPLALPAVAPAEGRDVDRRGRVLR